MEELGVVAGEFMGELGISLPQLAVEGLEFLGMDSEQAETVVKVGTKAAGKAVSQGSDFEKALSLKYDVEHALTLGSAMAHHKHLDQGRRVDPRIHEQRLRHQHRRHRRTGTTAPLHPRHGHKQRERILNPTKDKTRNLPAKTLHGGGTHLQQKLKDAADIFAGKYMPIKLPKLPSSHIPFQDMAVGIKNTLHNFPHDSFGNVIPPNPIAIGCTPGQSELYTTHIAPLSFGGNQVGVSTPNKSAYNPHETETGLGLLGEATHGDNPHKGRPGKLRRVAKHGDHTVSQRPVSRGPRAIGTVRTPGGGSRNIDDIRKDPNGAKVQHNRPNKTTQGHLTASHHIGYLPPGKNRDPNKPPVYTGVKPTPVPHHKQPPQRTHYSMTKDFKKK